MLKATAYLEKLQVKKLLHCIKERDLEAVNKLSLCGIPHIVNCNDPDDGMTGLICAVRNNDISVVKFLLKLGASLDGQDYEGKTALMQAVQNGNREMVETLITAGAKTAVLDNKGKSAFFYGISSSKRNLDCLSLILDKTIDINHQDENGETVLHVACKEAAENESFIEILIKNGASPDIPSLEGRTPLMEACSSGGYKVVNAFIQNGADIDVCSKLGRACVHEASRNGHLKVLFSLSGAGADFNVLDSEGNNPLHLAAKQHDICCRFLGNRGCDPKVKNLRNQLPRTIATEAKKKLCVKVLRKLESNFGKVTKNTEPWALRLYDWSISQAERLTEAFSKMAVELAEEELVEQADEAPTDKENQQKGSDSKEGLVMTEGESLPQDSSKKHKQSTEMTKSTKKRKMAKKTPAVKLRFTGEEFECVMFSLEAPYSSDNLPKLINLHQKNNDGCIGWKDFLTGKRYVNKTYLSASYEKKGRKKEKGGKVKTKKRRKIPMQICTLPKEAIFRRADGGPSLMYIPKKATNTDRNRFNAENMPVHLLQDDSIWYLSTPERQYIPFHAAAKYGDLDSIRSAIKEGYSVDTRDNFYKTPLMVAAHSGNLEAVTALVQLGADVNAKDNFWWTPLHHAAHAGLIDVAELLIRNGATVDARAMNGSTPLLKAVETSRAGIVEYLLSQGARLTVRTRKGSTPYDVALTWADPRITELVHFVPKKQTKPKAKPKRKKVVKKVETPPEMAINRLQNDQQARRPFLSRMLAQNVPLEATKARQDTRFHFYNPWCPEPNRWQRLIRIVEDRERFGWDHGLPGSVSHAFNKQVESRVKEVEADQ